VCTSPDGWEREKGCFNDEMKENCQRIILDSNWTKSQTGQKVKLDKKSNWAKVTTADLGQFKGLQNFEGRKGSPLSESQTERTRNNTMQIKTHQPNFV
jgi:hypothetical protein